MIETRRLIISEAGYSDISAVIELESHEDNRDYLWIGTEEEHRSEIEDQDHLLLMFRKKEERVEIVAVEGVKLIDRRYISADMQR